MKMSCLVGVYCCLCTIGIGTVTDDGLTLRDASIATDFISMGAEESGCVIQYHGSLTRPGRLANLYQCDEWHLSCPDLSPEIEVRFRIGADRESEEDLAVHVSPVRVVYIHICSCRNEDGHYVSEEEFEIEGVRIAELFRRVDELSIHHWERVNNFDAAIRTFRAPKGSE